MLDLVGPAYEVIREEVRKAQNRYELRDPSSLKSNFLGPDSVCGVFCPALPMNGLGMP